MFFRQGLLRGVFHRYSRFLYVDDLCGGGFARLVTIIGGGHVLLRANRFSRSKLSVPKRLRVVVFGLLHGLYGVMGFGRRYNCFQGYVHTECVDLKY